MVRKWLVAATATFALAAAVSPANAQAVQVEDIRVQLFYEHNGSLSDDLTKQKNLSLWNTIIGEGDAKGPSSAFLVSVVLRSTPEKFVKQASVSVTIVDAKKKSKLLERRFDGLAFGKDGRTVRPVFVENRTCAPTTIVAKAGASEKSVTLPFQCGE